MAIVVFEHSELTGSLRLGEVLRDLGHRLRVIKLHRGDPLPIDLDDVDGVITCGGGSSANDEQLPWLTGEMEYLRRAAEGDLPVVGLCLGSQILARALGGSVGSLDGGIELGWHPVKLSPVGREDPLHAGIAWSSYQPHWHREEVNELPPGARVLASSERCKIQTWSLGLRTYGFQYHPEIREDSLDVWAEDEPAAMREAGVTVDQLRQQTARHYPTCERLSSRLFEAIAMLLMPVDRRYQGLAKDVHH